MLGTKYGVPYYFLLPMQDIIGDVHGHATKLKALLDKLGYERKNGAYRHPERTVLFLGDYIDRGPDNPETLRIVREMVDAGTAIALMGNHEYNALAFNTLREDGKGYLRPHLIKNFKQHGETLLQFQNRQAEYDEYVAWFKTLPLFYENEHFRAVHASWHQPSIEHLQDVLTDDTTLSDAALQASAVPDSYTMDAVEKVLKGVELPLPAGRSFLDKDKNERYHIRYKWWENPVGASYEQLSVLPGLDLSGFTYVDESGHYYDENQKPVFFGHYWLRGEPNLYRGNVCCLDYSVAKGGVLVAYRYGGERALSPSQLVWV